MDVQWKVADVLQVVEHRVDNRGISDGTRVNHAPGDEDVDETRHRPHLSVGCFDVVLLTNWREHRRILKREIVPSVVVEWLETLGQLLGGAAGA